MMDSHESLVAFTAPATKALSNAARFFRISYACPLAKHAVMSCRCTPPPSRMHTGDRAAVT